MNARILLTAWALLAPCLGLWAQDRTGQPAADMTFGKVYYVDANHPAANDANAGTEDKPLRHIQAALDRVQPGQTVLIRGGTYRESLRWKTPGRPDARITLAAAPGARVVVKGSVVVRDWERITAKEAGLGGEYPQANLWVRRNWERKKILPSDEPTATWRGGMLFHDRARQAFWKDAPLEGAGRLAPAFFRWELEEGRLYHDETAKTLTIYLPPGIDPNAEGIEVSVRPILLGGYPGWAGSGGMEYVTVRGIEFRHGAPRGLSNTAQVSCGRVGFVFEDNTVSWGDYEGLYVGGEGAILRRNKIGYNGIGGLGGTGKGHLFEDNLVVGNNVDSYVYYNSVNKFVYLENATFRRHRGMHNNGSGLWFDISCNNNVVEDSQFLYNAGNGMDIEISHGNLVRNCIFAFNSGRSSGYQLSHRGMVSRRGERERTYSGGGGGWGLSNRQSSGTRIYNCLFYGNSFCGLGVYGGIRQTNLLVLIGGQRQRKVVHITSQDVVVMNNILADNGKLQYQFPDEKTSPECTGGKSDYNLLWGEGLLGPAWTLDSWQAKTGHDKHSRVARADVGFPQAGMFEPAATSPAIDAGTAIEVVPTDMRGVKRPVGKACDIGPFEKASMLGAEHRPQIPLDLVFTPVDLAKVDKSAFAPWRWPSTPMQLDKVGQSTFVRLDQWPVDQKEHLLAGFQAVLPKDGQGRPTAGQVVLAGVPFDLVYPDTILRIFAANQGPDTGRTYVTIGRKADWLFFLHAAKGVREGQTAVTYRIFYADGGDVDINMVAGQGICELMAPTMDVEAAFERERGTHSAIAWQGPAIPPAASQPSAGADRTKSAKQPSVQATVLRMAWSNPRPDVEIVHVRIVRGIAKDGDLAILGITAGKSKQPKGP